MTTNREQLQKEDPLELARLRERDEEIREIYSIIAIFVRQHPNPPSYQLEDTLNEIEQELIERGTVDLSMLACPFYLASYRHVLDDIVAASEFPDAPKHARNSAVFAKYGVFQALPVCSGDKNYVRTFLAQNGRHSTPDWGPKRSPSRRQRCATNGCPSEVQYDVNDHSSYPPPQWFCPSCKSRNAHVVRKPTPHPADMLFTKDDVIQSPNDPWFGRLPGAKP